MKALERSGNGRVEVNQGKRAGRGESEAGPRLWQQEVGSSDGQWAKLLTRAMHGCVTDVGPSSITSTEEAPMTGYRMITCPSF